MVYLPPFYLRGTIIKRIVVCLAVDLGNPYRRAPRGSPFILLKDLLESRGRCYVIILNSTSCARVTNVNELGAKTAYVNPLDGGQQMSLYQLYLKKHLKALER